MQGPIGCSSCGKPLSAEERKWGTGMCDSCYNLPGAHPPAPSRCKSCHKLLTSQEIKWKTGMCNNCYDKVTTTAQPVPAIPSCSSCHATLSSKEIQWGTGLCDTCYSNAAKQKKKTTKTNSITCSLCTAPLSTEEAKWGTGLCNGCYNKKQQPAKQKKKTTQTNSITCSLCTAPLSAEEAKWGTQICDYCYNKKPKRCSTCDAPLSRKELKWGTGRCNQCYNNLILAGETLPCRVCTQTLTIKEMQWGSGKCNHCWDTTCTDCDKVLSTNETKWGHKKCNNCWDNRAKWKKSTKASAAPCLPPFDKHYRPTVSLADGLKGVGIPNIESLLSQAESKANSLQSLYPQIPKESLMAIYLYTVESPIYKDLNHALRTDNRQAMQAWLCYSYHLIRGLDLLPDYVGTVYRGERSTSDDDAYWESQARDKSSMWFNYFVSTSKGIWTAQSFGPLSNQQSKIFHMQIATGKDISGISAFPNEQEVLLRPLFNYTVDSANPNTIFSNCVNVHLTETDRQRANSCVWWLD